MDTLKTCLTPQTLKYFRDLDRNNNREWFAEHKAEYQKNVAAPMKQLAATLAPMVQELDPLVVVDPNRIVSRIYRDTRFSNDKTPYRPRVWIAFKRNVDCWAETPVFFFQVQEKEYMFGMGMYSANPATMRRFREQIDADPDFFLQVITPIRKSKTLQLASDCYKRPLPCEHTKEIVPWYQSKSIGVLGTREPDKTLLSPKLADFLIDRFVQLKPLYDFLWRATVIR